MMLKEFEERTNIFPDANLYEAIEEAYNDYPGNKDQFCKAYKANTDGLAEKIQRAATLKVVAQNAKIEELTAEIETLKLQIEREQEWKPFTPSTVISQEEYDELANSTGTEKLSDERAKALLYDWYGFAAEKVKIFHSTPIYEINRHGQLRQIGTADRSPLYNATDWNYIRFNCGCMSYELVDDTLRVL